jgi:prepilin-type N-terminal cleavage/methylation domain-containing protein
MHTDVYMRKCENVKMRRRTVLIYASTHIRIHGFTLTELIVVVLIVSLFVLLAVTNLSGLLTRSTFRAQAQELVSTMQMAASAAAESERRYEVTIDIAEQSYTLRQITSPDLSQVLEEEIIAKNNFSDNCRVVYVLFDDLVETDEDHQTAMFRAGHAGWQNGGKIVLLDEDERPYSVVVNRINRIVTLKEGDVELLMPKRQDEVPF